MRLSIAAALFAVCSVAFVAAQEMNSGQELPKAKAGVAYPIKVHVSGIHLRTRCVSFMMKYSSCSDVIYANATINGQKIELMGNEIWLPERPIGLVPADYQARLLKTGHPAGAHPIGDKYELVLPDRTIWRCAVTGMSE